MSVAIIVVSIALASVGAAIIAPLSALVFGGIAVIFGLKEVALWVQRETG